MTEKSDPVIRKTVSLPASTWRLIEDFQFNNRIKRETIAIRLMVEIAAKQSGIAPD